MNETQLECTGYDLALGSMYGIRAFRVDRLGRLKALHYSQVFKPGENVSVCRKDEASGGFLSLHFTISSTLWGEPEKKRPEPKPHTRIDPLCTCGFYAYHDGVADYGQTRETVTGIIEGYGKTTVGTRGYRSEKAKVVAVITPTYWRIGWSRFYPVVRRHGVTRDQMARLQRNYPDVAIYRSRKAALRDFPMAPSAEQTPETDPLFWERSA